ncbi:MAG: hypothetical protein K0Q65_3074 [Clostridia bacterium]|nr:hypothetical protein [Clostridia bacterium]
MKGKGLIQRLGFLKSMGFGIFLLVFILILSVIGTILPQNQGMQFYVEGYSEYLAELILIFGLDHLFTSTLFAMLFVALAINLLLCNTMRLGKTITKVRQRYNIAAMKKISSYKLTEPMNDSLVLSYIFKGYGAAGIFKYKCKEGIYFSSKNTLGYFGSWFLHLGIMLIILSYIYGQATFFSGELFGVPGERMNLEGTEVFAEIKSFDVSYREDGSVEQYITELQLQDTAGGQQQHGSISVNNPMRYKGYSFYQTSMGWAAECKTFKAFIPLKSQLIYEKTALNIPEENIAIALTKFYPDFAADSMNFSSLSDKPNNPALLYSIFYRNELVKMDIVKPGEYIQWNDYSFTIDNFRRYTYLKVNKMRGQLGAAIGGLLIILGLALTFYVKPRELAIKQDGEMLFIYGKAAEQNSNNSGMNALSIENFINNKEDGIDVK